MAWAQARTWVTGEVVTGAEMNGTRDNLRYFKGDSTWIEPALLNGWSVYDTTTYYGPRYKKFGRTVKITGLIKSGTVATDSTGQMFTLAADYRPFDNLTFLVVSNNAYGRVDVHSDGGVFAYAGSNLWFSLAGTQFPVLT